VGRWTDAEHTLFLDGLARFGRDWKDIAAVVRTRTVVQVRTHAQKYFQKVSKKGPDGQRAAYAAAAPSAASAAAAAAARGRGGDGDQPHAKRQRVAAWRLQPQGEGARSSRSASRRTASAAAEAAAGTTGFGPERLSTPPAEAPLGGFGGGMMTAFQYGPGADRRATLGTSPQSVLDAECFFEVGGPPLLGPHDMGLPAPVPMRRADLVLGPLGEAPVPAPRRYAAAAAAAPLHQLSGWQPRANGVAYVGPLEESLDEPVSLLASSATKRDEPREDGDLSALILGAFTEDPYSLFNEDPAYFFAAATGSAA